RAHLPASAQSATSRARPSMLVSLIASNDGRGLGDAAAPPSAIIGRPTQAPTTTHIRAGSSLGGDAIEQLVGLQASSRQGRARWGNRPAGGCFAQPGQDYVSGLRNESYLRASWLTSVPISTAPEARGDRP